MTWRSHPQLSPTGNISAPFEDDMSTARITIDGLWHCLCPSFRSSALTKSSIRPRVKIRLPTGDLASKRSIANDTHVPSTERIRAVQPRHGRPLPAGLAKQRSYRGHERLRLEDETTAVLYDLMRTSATYGQTREVESIVEHLVVKRQEKPNTRLYSCLVLVNVNPREGSTSKVQMLLQEMEEHGLPMDVGLCHDILKV